MKEILKKVKEDNRVLQLSGLTVKYDQNSEVSGAATFGPWIIEGIGDHSDRISESQMLSLDSITSAIVEIEGYTDMPDNTSDTDN